MPIVSYDPREKMLFHAAPNLISKRHQWRVPRLKKLHGEMIFMVKGVFITWHENEAENDKK